MSFTKGPDGVVTCDRCGDTPLCPPRDDVTVARWRREHACPNRTRRPGDDAA